MGKPERYIEVNELTADYLDSFRDGMSPEDLEIVKRLIHDRKWWSDFHSQSPEKQREMLNFLPTDYD